MVATISARKNIAAARQYFTHLVQDDYYLKNEDVGVWFGRAAKFLRLAKEIDRNTFERALNGQDPTSGDQLVQIGAKHKTHQPGWDICLSAPKAVSLLWALASNNDVRASIELAHKKAVDQTCFYVERSYGICRRGKGGRVREPTAGLLFGLFHHRTSRSLCPQLHSHLFTFNIAPRKDGTWGTILSKPLYSAQKRIGARYRECLHRELQRISVPSKLHKETITVEGFDKDLEKAFSIRRHQILKAVRDFGYSKNSEGFEKANLRTRPAKQAVPFEYLLKHWQLRAEKCGYHPDSHYQIFEKVQKALKKGDAPEIQLASKRDREISAALKMLVVYTRKAFEKKAHFSLERMRIAARTLINILNPRKRHLAGTRTIKRTGR